MISQMISLNTEIYAHICTHRVIVIMGIVCMTNQVLIIRVKRIK